MEKLNILKEKFIQYFEGFSKASADTFAWISVVMMICATVPGFLAVMAHVTDRMPPLDIILMVWGGLLLYFVRSAISLLNCLRISYIDAVIYFCEQKGLDVETAASLIRNNSKLKASIQLEAEKLNYLPKTTQLPV